MPHDVLFYANEEVALPLYLKYAQTGCFSWTTCDWYHHYLCLVFSRGQWCPDSAQAPTGGKSAEKTRTHSVQSTDADTQRRVHTRTLKHTLTHTGTHTHTHTCSAGSLYHIHTADCLQMLKYTMAHTRCLVCRKIFVGARRRGDIRLACERPRSGPGGYKTFQGIFLISHFVGRFLNQSPKKSGRYGGV